MEIMMSGLKLIVINLGGNDMKLKEWLEVTLPSDLYVIIESDNCGQIHDSISNLLNNYHDVLEEEIEEVMIDIHGDDGIEIITR